MIAFFSTSTRSGTWSGGDGAWVELSGKMHVLARLLAHLRRQTDDRIVLVSNYTQVDLHGDSYQLRFRNESITCNFICM